MHEYLSILLLAILVVWPWVIRWLTKLEEEGVSIFLTIVAIIFGLGSFVFTCRLIYIGMENFQ